MKRQTVNTRGGRGAWRLHSKKGLTWLALGGTVRRVR